MNDVLRRYDSWLTDGGPAALVLREHLMPVEGHDGVVFPSTFAASEDKTFKGGYNIDEFPDGTNVCLIDSVGSQANRIEPLFSRPKYASLVPQVTITAGDKKISLLEAGHRAGDAIVRCSELQQELQSAFKALQNGNAIPLAMVAPTSLVFGAWDSRDTQVKVPRLVASTIRAYNVRKLTRSAQYVPATEYVDRGLLDEPADKKVKDAYAERGFIHVPASGSPGGVIAAGGIRREATLHLAALRLLAAGDDNDKTLGLRRYVLGLAITAFTAPSTGYLRQGCNLVPDPKKPIELAVVHANGQRESITFGHEDALAFAEAAAKKFEPGRDREVPFDREAAKRDVTSSAKVAPKKDSKATSKEPKKK